MPTAERYVTTGMCCLFFVNRAIPRHPPTSFSSPCPNLPFPQTKTPAIGAVMAEGSASKMGGGPLFRFKKCYLVLQSSTLFIFENKETYEARKPALEWIPMGNVLLDTDPESEFNKKSKEFAFTFKECSSDLSVTLGCPTAEEQQYWLKALGACNARRVKLIVVTCVEEMLSRGVDVEGIFRVSGSKQVIEAIKRDYDAGKPVDVTSVKDIHALSGLLKLCVRELYEPLFTWDNYSDFVTLGGLGAEATADQIREVMAKLPMSNQGLLRYMFRFLWRVAQHEKVKVPRFPHTLLLLFCDCVPRPGVRSGAGYVHGALHWNPCLVYSPCLPHTQHRYRPTLWATRTWPLCLRRTC